VGQLDVSCTVTHGGTFETARTQCSGTATLPDGQLAFDAAVVFGKDDVNGAITGGTFTSQNNENAPNKDTFEIQIPKK
jgi:hypothetical protein